MVPCNPQCLNHFFLPKMKKPSVNPWLREAMQSDQAANVQPFTRNIDNGLKLFLSKYIHILYPRTIYCLYSFLSCL